jgi:anhydro-N-acetylmuramic acid kinase
VDIDVDIKVVAHKTIPYPPEVRAAILSVSNAPTHTTAISRLNFLLGELFAGAVKQSGVPIETIELIGSHGQTIFHEGDPVDVAGHRVASTLQIGEGAVIAERTGIPTVSDFRTADMAAGGKGAPLVPFLDFRLFRHPTISRVALNIGGIANITVIPAGASPDQVIAFDTGPGNMVMDALAPPFDRNGENARAGRVNEAVLAKVMDDPYYRLPPPKSCGREQYGAEFLQSGIDVATAAELTVRTIALAIDRHPDTQEVIVSGGGAHNGYLMERLRAVLRARVITTADLGIDVDAKEAILFAVLAHETWNRRAGNIPSATGARHPAVLGKLSL